MAESSIIPPLGATGTKEPGQNGATHDQRGSAFGTSPESTTTNTEACNETLAINIIGGPPNQQNVPSTPKRKSSTLAREEENYPLRCTIADLGSSGPSRASNHALRDYQVQQALLEQHINKRLMMTRRDSDGLHVQYRATSNRPPGSDHALQDYQMQLMLLDQQNKMKLMMNRQERDNTPVFPDPTSSSSTRSPQDAGGSPEPANNAASSPGTSIGGGPPFVASLQPTD